MKVVDADNARVSTNAHEDIIVKLHDSEILVGVKGDGKKYPSANHITQVWKHLKYNQAVTDGALVLNYDINTPPEERGLAYTGEEESTLDEDIAFIDTRVLLQLALAVIDHGLPKHDAVEILFKKGRVTFDLENYLREAQSPEK